jgi:processive 1,2-diacylglycerol beta-glucosyltransferase
LITIITDFGVHPFWVYRGTDMYAVASELTKQKLENQDVASKDIKVTGIPVNQAFFKSSKKMEICRKLGIDENRFTVLVVTGSFGIGPVEKITDLLHKDAQMLVVCARNKKLYARLKAKKYPQLNLFGFVNNLEELMSIADVIITKPGGLSISELLVKEIAPIFISAIPGQETENAKNLGGWGIGVSANSPLEIKQLVLDYKDHPDKILRIKETIKGIKKPYSIQELYNVVCESGGGITHRMCV